MRWQLVAAAALWMATAAAAADPIAVRLWPGGGVTVETMDGPAVAVDVPSALMNEPEFAATKAAVQINGWSTSGAFRADRVSVKSSPAPGQSTLLEVDELRLLFVRDADQLLTALKEDATKDPLGTIHAALLPAAGSWTGSVGEVLDRLGPSVRLVVLPVTAENAPDGVTQVPHNTVAVPASGDAAVRRVALTTTPYRMSDEVAALFEAKEKASAASQAVFAKLSAAQMSHEPADGSHTPRWNAEHIRGTELLFFSQIFNAVDPAVPVMNRMPKQMPPQYAPAHPEWSGREEAAATARVQAFTRRYAYLLDGLDLDTKAPGSRFWTPRALLKQMDRHIGQHTANVQKKFEADDWPKE